jgi:hypothetical protein
VAKQPVRLQGQPDINLDNWETTTFDRTTWRSVIHKGAAAYEELRKLAAVQRRQARKSRIVRPTAEANIPYPYCSRAFRARIGFISHFRTHGQKNSSSVRDGQNSGHIQ